MVSTPKTGNIRIAGRSVGREVAGETKEANSGVLVIGLGRFGGAIAATLDRLGQEVLAVEKDPTISQRWSSRIPVIEADATDPEALEQLGASDFGIAVVSIGSSLESSVLTASNLVDLGIRQIWAKSVSDEHARILQRIGAHHVVRPETDAGQRVAHLVSGKLLDYIEVEDGFTIVKLRAPRIVQGMSLAESQLRTKYGVTVVGVKSPGKDFEYAVPETRINANDLLVVSGDSHLLERFAARP